MGVAFDPDWLRTAPFAGGAGLMEDEGIWYYFWRSEPAVRAAIREAAPNFRAVPSASLLLADALGSSHVVTIAAARPVPPPTAGQACLEASSSRDGLRHRLRLARGNDGRAVITAIQPV